MSHLKKASQNAKMSISKAGKAAISRDEGCKPHAYNDPVGLCTIGTGVKISNTRCTPQELARTYDPDELSASFHERLHEAERYVRHYVRESKLTQAQ